LGIMDLIICCVKSYDLEESIETLSPCIDKQTIILPFLNGVDAAERIKKMFPETEIWEGCVYIVARLIAPGVVKAGGVPSKFYFGARSGKDEKLKQVEAIFKAAGINADLSEDISYAIWEKFLFISTIATLTSYLDRSIGEILSKPEYTNLLMNLLNELKAVADAKGLSLSDVIIKKMVDRMISLPYETTSSMHHDFLKGGKTELNSLTGFVIEIGKQLNVPTPTYEKMFATLTSRTKTRMA
jgi:2-dehydropantoate 2-reductase